MSDTIRIPQENSTWFRFSAPQLRIINSPLPDLPQRTFLSIRGREAEEFTIIIPIEFDSTALTSGIEPGIYLGYIGENWEVYLNGHLVQRQMHLNEAGQIISRRNWRGVHFPFSGSILLEGTNILAFRIIGDPTYGVTGLYYSSPYYIDDYSIIKRRHLDILSMILCGIFGYTGLYYMIIFLSVRKKNELYNLYYSISSIILCIYTLMFSGIINNIIPNSDITIRLEYVSLFMLVPMLGCFIEHFGAQKITKITRGFLIFYGSLSLAQIFFSTQFGDDILMIWSASVLIYFSYIFFFNITRYYIRRRRKENIDTLISNILIGLVVVYLCGIYDVLDIIFFHNSSSLFLYSTFIFHLGMAITLSQRYQEMYGQLEESNIILEERVQERTLELEEQTAIALEASKAKSNFLAIMSHEIRTPLNAVIGFSEIELRNDLPSSIRESFTHIHRSGSFLLGIINEILDISKIESGKLDLINDEYETASLLSGTISLNRVRIGEKPIQFILEIDSGFPTKLIGDELRVRQILNNLLSNAIKYTNEGTVKLAASSEKTGTNEVRIQFTVTDTGIGIDSESMEKLFDNYTQLDTQANRRNEGIGLGLAITKSLAEMMGGGISVESEYGSGSCFTAWIIQEQNDIEIIGEETAEALRSFSYAFDINPESSIQERNQIESIDIPEGRILVVDDIPENLLVVRGFLKPYGLQIDTAGSGREAIELIEKTNISGESYHLIFMDHMMPEMDGVETLKNIRKLGVETPMIILTSNALRGMNEFYMEHGFQDYLSKPVNPNELDSVLRKWLINDNSSIDDNINFTTALNTQRLDKLNHFRFAFDSGRDIEPAFFKRFNALIQTLRTVNNELAEALIEAGNNEDAKKIREILPDFFNIMENQLIESRNRRIEEFDFLEILKRIKKLIEDDEITEAGKILKDIGMMNLNQEERDLYFILYDSLMEDKLEKTIEDIDKFLMQA
ncbi:MAG: ATP-binding protein [Treponema sp.]|nr:ATP-binding protein [Treponema sp.]